MAEKLAINQLDRELQNKLRSVYECEGSPSDFSLKKLVVKGDLARVELYLRCGASPNPKAVKTSYSTRTDWFPLEWAVTSGSVEMVELLLQFKADVNAKGLNSRRGLTALRLAVEQQKSAIVAKLLSAGACPESYQHHYGTVKARESRSATAYCDIPVLYEAVTRKKLEIAEMLLRKGAKANLPKSYKLNYSYLTEAIRLEWPEMVALLLQFGADVNFEVPRLGTTPLILAAKASKHAIEMCKILAQHGADVHAHEYIHKQHDALAVAVLQRDSELIRVLLELGAKANAVNSAPLSVAVNADAPHKASVKVVNTLLDHGAPVNDCDPSGEEPLLVAVRKQRTGVAEALLKRGATTNIVHSDLTPLKHAVLSNQEEMVRLLVSHGASPLARVFAPTVLSRGPEICCSALDVAKQKGSSSAILAVLDGSETSAEPEPTPAGDDEEKGPIAVRPRAPLAATISREAARASLQPIGVPTDTTTTAAGLTEASRAEVKRTVSRAMLCITSSFCQQAGRSSYCEWELVAPELDMAVAAALATTTSYQPVRREPMAGGVVIARGRTTAVAAPKPTKASAASASSSSVADWRNDGFKLSTGVTWDDSAKAKAMAHENQRCLRSCELRFKVKTEGGLFSSSKTVGEAWFPLSHLEIGLPFGTTAKFLTQLDYKKKRTGTLAFELTY